jgi:hypothetical protein
MSYLVCTNEFHGYRKGQMITDQAEIRKLLANDRGHHFVQIASPPLEAQPTEKGVSAAPAIPETAKK